MRLLLAAPLVSIIGGGPLVPVMMVYAMASDAVPESRRYVHMNLNNIMQIGNKTVKVWCICRFVDWTGSWDAHQRARNLLPHAHRRMVRNLHCAGIPSTWTCHGLLHT
jgi:hypothetical protein